MAVNVRFIIYTIIYLWINKNFGNNNYGLCLENSSKNFNDEGHIYLKNFRDFPCDSYK